MRSELGWRRELFLGLLRTPCHSSQQYVPSTCRGLCPVLCAEHKAVKHFSIMPGLNLDQISEDHARTIPMYTEVPNFAYDLREVPEFLQGYPGAF